MSIRRTATAPAITSDDLQFTHRGRTLAIELTDIEDLRFIFVVERVNGVWVQAPVVPLEDCSDAQISAAGGPAMWIRSVFVSALNEWLATLFQPALVAGDPAPSGIGVFDQVDTLLQQMIAFAPQADGTLKAILKAD